MNLTHLILWLGSLAVVLWCGRRIPLSGMRRMTVVTCRSVAISLLCLALLGLARRSISEQPQHVVYLVDGSQSIDEQQLAWMARRISSLESLRPTHMPRAVITFGNDAQSIFPFERERLTDPSVVQTALRTAQIDRAETNLEAALLEALHLLPTGQGGNLVLFSDGQETAGNTARILAHVRRLGIKVFPVSVPVFGKVATVWDTLSAPPVVQRGAPVSLQMVLYSGASHAKMGHVTISLGGIPIKRQRARIRPGWQVLTVSVPAIQQGTMALEVHFVIPEEGLEERRMVYTEVEGPPHLLVVDDEPTVLPILARALKRREIEISLARPRDLPTQSLPLLDYDAVLLFGVPKSSFTGEQVEALRSYVETFGGGLIMVGLGGDLAEEISTPAPLDALLPVTFEAKGLQESQRRVCMIMLIDRSASMLGPRIAATKRAAVELVKQLSPEDLIGVLAFDTKPYVVVEVQPAGWVGPALIDKLVRLRSTGGTDVYPALTAAKARLDQTDATLKHIILLSDGNTPFRRDLYRQLTAAFKADGVSVSTIGIGSSFVNTKYLQWLANETDGTFYRLRSLNELPRLIAQDTQDALGRLPFTEGYFHPERSETSDWFDDVTDWPALRGYLTTTAKPGSQVEVIVPTREADPPTNNVGGGTGDPLLARWSLGRGRVAVFTSDADTRWSPGWIRWPGFEGWWAHVVRWAMRRRLSEELFVWVDQRSGAPRLVLEGTLRDPRGELLAADGSDTVPLSFVQTGRWRWHASLEQVPSGWHELALESRKGDTPIFARRWVQVGTPPASHEVTGQLPRDAMLRQLAQSTAGATDVPDLAFLPPTTTATSREPLLPWFLPPVVLLLLAEIALRGSSML